MIEVRVNAEKSNLLVGVTAQKQADPPHRRYIWTHPLDASKKLNKNEGIDAVIYSVYLIE